MNDEYTYSIIIPHKNTPDLLNRCVDSIPIRDDAQIIVVDDNSDVDKKPKIERMGVEVILLDAEQSKGAGRARNIGLEHAKGKWLLFADADDYYTEHLNDLLDKYAQEDVIDIVYLNACIFSEDGVVRPWKIEWLIQNYQKGKRYSEKYLRYSVWTPWTRMVSHKLVEENQLKFDEIPVGNDLVFGLECSLYSKTIEVENTPIYMYYKPTQSRSQTDERRNSRVLDIMINLRGRKNKLYKQAGYRYISSYFALFYNSDYSKGIPLQKCYKRYFSVIKENNIGLMKDLYRYCRNRINTKICKLFNKS